MKKVCLLLAVLLLSGCGKGGEQPQNPPESISVGWSKPELVAFDIYAVNDLHGKLADTEQQPGVDELSAFLKQAQAAGNTVLLATGDMWQGASESNLTGGVIVTEWMNRLDFAAMTLGGHEFDWGEDGIRENGRLAEFPLLAINVYSRQTDKQADYCQSSVLLEADGVQIGVIGAIGNCYYSISGENTQDVYFKIGDELTALVKEESEKLRSQGADFIIYAIHDGFDRTTTGVEQISDRELGSYYDISLSRGYVDLVFEADTHYSYVFEDGYGVYHLQAGANNQGISYVRVLIDKANGEISVFTPEILSADKYSYLEDDPVVEELLAKYAQQIAPATKVLGSNGTYQNNYALCQLVAKLYRDAGVEKWGKEYDIVLGGGYLSCRSPGYLPAGQVSYSQLQSLLPFDNTITLCSISGRDLVSRFLETDNKAYHIKITDYGQSIRKNIHPDATYYVVTDSYTSDYAYNNLTVIDTYKENVFARDLLAEYITTGNLE